MMTGSSANTIDWLSLNQLVDPQSNTSNIAGTQARGEIQIRRDRENSMDQLNGKQRTIKDRLIARYSAENQNLQFVAEAEKYLKEYIIEQYNKNPAMYNGVVLPLEYDAGHDSQGKRESYFKNVWHSAYRYLVLCIDKKPNRWLHSNAGYLSHAYDSDGRRFACPSLSDDHRALIRAMWVALNDGEFELSPIHTTETAKQELVRTIASLGRAHNWDQPERPVMEQYTDAHGRPQTRQKTRVVNGQVKYVTEEYDDLDKDRPSCVWGVETRLTQFVMLALKADPNEQELKSNYIHNKFREEMIGGATGKNTIFNAIAKMDIVTLNKLQEALDELCVMYTDFAQLTSEQQALLKQIQCYNTRDLAQFIDSCKMQWGDFRFTQKLNERVEFQCKRFENYGQLILHLAQEPWGIFYDAITENIKARLQVLQTTPAAVVVEDIETLRAQLVELSLRKGDGAFMRYQAADEALIRQLATEHRAQLAQPEQAKTAVAQHQAREAARLAEEQRRRAEEARLAEAARLAEEQRRRAEEARLAEAARLAEEQRRRAEAAEQDALRRELFEFAVANRDENLAQLIFDYSLPQLRQEQQRQHERATRLAEAAPQTTAAQPQPALLAGYSYARQGQQPVAVQARGVPQVTADIAAVFVSEFARQFLAIVNQSEALIHVLNQFSAPIAMRFASVIDANKLNMLCNANLATKVHFLTQYAQRQGLTIEAFVRAPAQPRVMQGVG